MFLSAQEIRAEVGCGRLVIDPFDPQMLKPASYVLTLGGRFRTWGCRTSPLDLSSRDAASALGPPQTLSAITLQDRTFVLACSAEIIGLPMDLVGIISTLSHVARFGISTHLDSWLVSPGFGHTEPTALTLELVSCNPSPVTLDSGMPVCHISFARASGVPDPTLFLATSIYEGKEAPSPPLLVDEFPSLSGP